MDQVIETISNLKAAVGNLCLQHHDIDSASPLEQACFFEVLGHSCKMLNALGSHAQESTEVLPSLVEEGRLICDLVRTNDYFQQGVMQ